MPLYGSDTTAQTCWKQGGGIRGEIIVPERRLELKHDATGVELTSTVRFL